MKYFLTLFLIFLSLVSFAQDSFVNVEILTDNYPSETTWEILGTNPGGNTSQIFTGGPYTAQATTYTTQVLLHSNWIYEFIAYDSYGDGICCQWGDGLITLSNPCEGTIWSDPFIGNGPNSANSISHTFSVEPCDPGFGCTDDAATNYDPGANVDDGSCEYPPCPGLVSFEVIQDPCQFPPQLVWEQTPGANCSVTQVMWSSNLDQLGDNPYPINGATYFYVPYTIPFQTYYVQLGFADGGLSEIYEFVKEPCIAGCLDPLALNYNPFALVPGPCDYPIEACPEGEVLVSVEITTDQYPGETTWDLTNQDGVILASGGPYNDIYTPQMSSFCVTEGDVVTFNLYDLFGDGVAGSLWGGSDGSALVTLDCGNVQDTIFVLDQANFGAAISSLPYATQGCEAFAIAGCTNPGFVEFDPMATISIPEDCLTPVILGCTEEEAFNYCIDCNQQEIIPTCEYTLTLTDGAGDGWFGSYLGVIQNGNVMGPFSLIEGYEESFTIELSATSPVDIIFATIGNSFTTANQCGFSLVGPEGNVTLEGGTNIWNDPILPLPYRYRGIPYCGNTCIDVVLGCIDNTAVNFEPLANTDDESCYYNPGCLNPGYVEYYTQGFEPDFEPDGACQTFAIFGCTDIDAFNYNPEANVDNEGCIPKIFGCTNPLAFNYNVNANTDDGSCEAISEGCTDPTAFNYEEEANTDDGSCIEVVFGCIDSEALNFNPLANTDNDSCIPVIEGCTDEGALNFNSEANVEDGSCIAILYGCTDQTALNYNELANVDNGTCIEIVEGCTNPIALNYNAEANVDDLSCVLPIYGCTDPEALNYNELANVDNDTCIPVIEGCMNPEAINFNPEANIDDLSCILPIYGCTDETAFNYNELANVDNGSCIPIIEGCTNPEAFNFNPEANTEDFSCEEFIYGCTNPESLNYDPEANTDNDSCIDIVEGCMDQNAWNYNELANVDSGDCLYDAGCIGGPGEPYWLNDGCFAWVIDVSPNCCTSEWNGGCQSLYNYCYDNNEVVGIDEYGETNIIVFPNPTRDILNIASNLNINATLYNAMGQPVLQENNVRQIDMSEFEGGIYNLILSYENIQFTKKIIKQ